MNSAADPFILPPSSLCTAPHPRPLPRVRGRGGAPLLTRGVTANRYTRTSSGNALRGLGCCCCGAGAAGGVAGRGWGGSTFAAASFEGSIAGLTLTSTGCDGLGARGFRGRGAAFGGLAAV